MRNRSNKKLYAASVLSLIVLGIGAIYLLSVMPYQSPQAIGQAREFVDALRTGSLKKAYSLTSQKDSVGNSFTEFVTLVDAQFRGRKVVKFQLRDVWPFQSYGNRLRRWVNRRDVEIKKISVDFLLYGEIDTHVIPFEVQQTHTENGGWIITFFQSHAL